MTTTLPDSRTTRLGASVLLSAGVALLGAATSLAATTNNVIGTYSSWPTNWVALNALNDPNDGLSQTELDFVGNTNNAGAYYAYNTEYVFFRQRVQVGTVVPSGGSATFHDAHFVLIDLVGQDYNTTTKTLQTGNDGMPDYGFVWDSKSNDNGKHGLEMMVRVSTNAHWSGVQMDDIDGLNAQKGTNDINGNSRTTDGYLRTIDQQTTVNFGTTTFIDYAVKWSYLQTYTGLNSNQPWRVAFVALPDRTDHNAFNTGDIAGGANPTSLVTQGWGSVYSTPMSSAIDLRAFQGADGIYVEYVAHDVENDGFIVLNLCDASGAILWAATNAVVPSASSVCRIKVPGLVVGGSYNFWLKDETGKGWSAPSVVVTPFAADMVQMSPTGVNLAFSSLPGRTYEIQWVAQLGDTWQRVTNVAANSARTSVFVRHPNPRAPAGFFRVQLK